MKCDPNRRLHRCTFNCSINVDYIYWNIGHAKEQVNTCEIFCMPSVRALFCGLLHSVIFGCTARVFNREFGSFVCRVCIFVWVLWPIRQLPFELLLSSYGKHNLIAVNAFLAILVFFFLSIYRFHSNTRYIFDDIFLFISNVTKLIPLVSYVIAFKWEMSIITSCQFIYVHCVDRRGSACHTQTISTFFLFQLNDVLVEK